MIPLRSMQAARLYREIRRRMRAKRVRAGVVLRSWSRRLSLGVDLGFGQPMEHVLRQC